MISWHRVGQKVTPQKCSACAPGCDGEGSPRVDGILTIGRLPPPILGYVVFEFVEHPGRIFAARCYRPVYPEIIDQLRTLPDLTLERERVKEEA